MEVYPGLKKVGGPAWLLDIWIVEQKGTFRYALLIDRAFRKRLELDDFKARDKLSRFNFTTASKNFRHPSGGRHFDHGPF